VGAADEVRGPDCLLLAGFYPSDSAGDHLDRGPQGDVDLAAQANGDGARLVNSEVDEAGGAEQLAK
jgi:hypothetical protein